MQTRWVALVMLVLLAGQCIADGSASGSASGSSSAGSAAGSSSAASGGSGSAAGSASGSAAASGSGSSSDASDSGPAPSSETVAVRVPMSGEAMARLLAEPWPADVKKEVDNHKLCHGSTKLDIEALKKKRIALITVSYKTPLSLANSVKTWKDSGLLDLVDDKIMWLNAATDEDRKIGKENGFRILEPRFFLHHTFITPWAHRFPDRNAPQRAQWVLKGQEENRWTVAPSLAHAADVTGADYILFLEKDFMIDPKRTPEDVRSEILNAFLYAERGIKLFRLRSMSDREKEGWPRCCSRKCRYQATGGTAWTRQRNWFSYLCDKPLPGVAVSQGLAHECDASKTRCFTAWDSNWSNNPFLANRQWMYTGIGDHSPLNVALWGSSTTKNGKFEVNMLNANWGKDKASGICSTLRGLFIHQEIDGRRRLRGAEEQSPNDPFWML